MKSSERRMPLAGGRLITNLRVSELKKELEKRGLSTEGVKVVLTVRLNKALRDEGLDPADHQFERISSPLKRITRKSSEMSKQAAVVIGNSEKEGKSEEIPNKIDEMEAVVDEEGVERDVYEGEDVVKENDEKREDTVEDVPSNQLLDDSNDDLEIIDEEIEALKKEYKKENDVEFLENKEFEKAVRVVPDALEERKDVVDEPKYKGKQKTVEVPEVVTIEDSDEPEGEDEFEEEMEPPIEPETTSHVAGIEEKKIEVCEKLNNDVKATPICSSTTSAIPADDEMFLDYEEDLLEDPLDEQPTPDRPPSKNNNNITASLKDEQLAKNTTSSPGRKANTVTSIQKSTSSSTPGGGADSGSFLFADDAKKTSIWIRGMTPQTKASSVKQLASQYGKVVQSKIFNSRPINGEVKNCFALVTFADVAAMELSIVSLHKKNYQGRVLRVEKVSESHLTNSAEKIAKEKRAAEEIDKKLSASESPEGTKKRAIITAPEVSTPPAAPRRERQSIQAPPAAHSSHEDPKPRPAKRPAIQPPERSRSRESQRHHRDSSSSSRSTRKVITFKGPDQIPDAERDSRHTIAAPVGPRGSKGARLTPPLAKRSARAGSAQRGGSYREDAPGSESLIISARVDTSGCRGGGMAIKRSIERSVPNNISTSELRRNQIHTGGGLVPPILPGARASYQTEKYAREHRSGSCSKRRPSPDRGNRRQRDISERGNEGRRRQEEPSVRRYPHSASLIPEEPLRRRQHDEQAEREKAMLEILRRKEEEHLIREEKLRLEREREKMKFEAEKLEKAKLELELMKQKLVLQQAAMSIQRSDGVRPADNREADGRRSSRSGVGSSSSRRRPAGEVLSSTIAAKIRADERTDSRSRRDTGERARSRRGEDRGGRNSSSSNRPAASSTSYGIQTAGVLPTRGHNSSSDFTTSSANNYRNNGDGGSTTSTYGNQGSIGAGGGYQSYTTQYQDPSFQVWGGLDAQGHIPMDTNWTTGATPSTSTSSGGSQWQHTSYNTAASNTSGRRQDYQYRINAEPATTTIPVLEDDAPEADNPPPPSLAVMHTAPQPIGYKRARAEDRSDLGYYSRYCPTLSGPHSAIVRRSVTIPFNEMDILSTAVYRHIVQVVYAGNAPPADLIQEDDFIGVVRAIFKSKIDHVSSKISGVRPAAHLPLASTIPIPRVLADAINAYGSFFANEGVTQYYPIAAVAPQGENPPSLTTTHVIAFAAFIEIAALRGFISTSLITPAVEGTGAWMLYTSESGGSRSNPGAHADANSLDVHVRAQFREFSPADAFIAALIVNTRDCVTLHGCTEYPFAGPEIRNVPMLRRQIATS